MDTPSALGLTQPQASRYLAQLLQEVPVGVMTVDLSGVVLAFNRAAQDILAAGGSLGVLVYEIVDDGEALRALIDDCFEGAQPEPQVFERRYAGSSHYVQITARGISVGTLEPIAMLLLEDVTARLSAERGLKRAVLDREFLTQVGAELAGSLDYAHTLNRLAHLVVSYLADWCGINVLEEDGAITRLAVSHADPAKEDLIHELESRHPHDPTAQTGVPLVLRTGQSLLYPVVTDDLLVATAHNEDYLRIVRELGFRSCMIVPLVAHGEIMGAITFVVSQEGRHYDESHLTLAEELARRAGLAVYNARLFKRVEESRARFASLARTLQASLLPPELPKIPGLEVAAAYRAGGDGLQIGGDFYDMFETAEGDWGIVVGDVQGHGAGAAAVTALARYTVRAMAMRFTRPQHVLYQVNRTLLRQGNDERFLSAVLARISRGARKQVTISNAGHPTPMLLRTDGTIEMLGGPGILLGLFPAPDLDEFEVELKPGDALLFYTDGVIEAGAPRNMLGQEGLKEVLVRCRGMSAQAIVGAVDEMLSTWKGETGHRDDCALLAVRVPP